MGPVAQLRAPYVVWGAELSPFVLKLEALLRCAGVPFRRLPRDGGRIENARIAALVERAKRDGTARRPPVTDPLDDYPLVPYLITPAREVLFDSSALAAWLDDNHPAAYGPLVPEDPALRFAARLVDEAFDEVGLYLVHHNRWKLAATDNDRPGLRLAREYARHLPPGTGRVFGAWFERRQVRRLPYLFSVAPDGYRVDGLTAAMTPPSRDGFPPTHDLLEEIWRRWVDGCDAVLRAQPFLLGDRFTVADASAYGQLSMNLTDPAATRALRERSPITFDWLLSIRDGKHASARGELRLSRNLTPLLTAIADVFPPLMQANRRAWEKAVQTGATRFNESAFDADECLYDGELLGRPYRSVAKAFQVRTWRDLCAEWPALPPDARSAFAELLPGRDLDGVFVAS